jgi:hypothetical protein
MELISEPYCLISNASCFQAEGRELDTFRVSKTVATVHRLGNFRQRSRPRTARGGSYVLGAGRLIHVKVYVHIRNTLDRLLFQQS